MAYSTIDKSTSFQNNVLYTGNSSTQTITGVDFQPDFTWIKRRDGTYNHYWFDVPRTAGYYIKCNQTAAQADGNPDHLTAWTSDGFNLGNIILSIQVGRGTYFFTRKNRGNLFFSKNLNVLYLVNA